MPQPDVSHRMVLFKHPLFALALSFAAGTLLASFTAASLSFFLICGCVSSLLGVFFYIRKSEAMAVSFLMLAFFFIGAILIIVETKSVAPDRVRRFYDEGRIAAEDPVEITGVLESEPELAPDGFYLSLQVEKIRIKETQHNATGIVSLFASAHDRATEKEYEWLELRYGARVRVMTSLGRVNNFRNPGVSLLTDYLDQRGIDATGVVKSPLLIERLDDERVFLPLAWLFEWRKKLLKLFHQRFSPETAGVLQASLLGNRYYLTHGAAERFREGGTFHVLVISGLHISFIGVVVLLVMRRLTRRRTTQLAVSLVILWAYTLAVGAEVSVVRAALMFSVVAIAPLVNRHASSMNALGAAALALLVWRPRDVFDPSLQLTFLSVLAIVALAWPILSKLQAIGVWRPTRSTPAPPICKRRYRALAELLYWNENEWQAELEHSPWQCRLFKTRLAGRLQNLHVQWLVRYVFAAVVVSVTVQLALLPFLVIYFHRLSIASIVLNIIVGVLMAILSLFGMAAVLISQINFTVSSPLIALTEAVSWIMVHSVDPFKTLRLASIRLPEYTGWAALAYAFFYLPLVALTIELARWEPIQHPSSVRRNKPSIAMRMSGLGVLLLAVIIVWHPHSARTPDGRLHVDFLDVGQGDAALISMPDGTTLLVDGGGKASFAIARRNVDEEVPIESFERDKRSIGEAVVSEYLWWRGLDHVDYIVATHADADHIDGLNAVARDFKVHSAIVAREPRRDMEFSKFATTLRDQGVPLHLIARGDTLRFGDVLLDVLWPVRTGDPNSPYRNDDSIVLRLRFGDRVFLLTGDIESRAESKLVHDPFELKCDVVKVAHHGSRTSSTEVFVNAAHPSLAVISVGATSAYGHPHKEVVERWRASGADVLTTGQNGMISVSTDGRDLSVETFLSDVK